MSQKLTKIFYGKNENRYIAKVDIGENVLKKVLNTTTCSKKISFNLMLMTTDHKVLLLERTQSFHFSKVVKDLKIGSINFGMLESLYPMEMEKIRKIFFDFIPPHNISPQKSSVFLFPGGHSKAKETIALTLYRELYEETGYTINFQNLRFNQSCLFKVLIYDLLVKKTFNNFVFPVKVDISSSEITNKFKNTKHTRNPTFIDIKMCTSLFDAFIKVQEYMLL
ncbi:hypothetical protein IIV22_129R [Invertebrate iridescent virus 22]|uniref:Nudix hydrolase domain-containing protein n=1 Tax=Invertebrate iridescent virus 22 TaxID=345198 RepID=S6DAZ7_9VIRU|nr:hypothetical protein IIV22_129R [Invertebrate iridescent virus 22]CCV01806.1 hypothetical protein IIV22_129R [Invertebrate iridescent virus 22]